MKFKKLITSLFLSFTPIAATAQQEENLNLHLKCETVEIRYEKNIWGNWKETSRHPFDLKVSIENNTFLGIPLKISDNWISVPLLYGGHLTQGEGGNTLSLFVDAFDVNRMTGKIEYWARLINLPDMPDRKTGYVGGNCRPYTPSKIKKLF